jgi:hypothetical protein
MKALDLDLKDTFLILFSQFLYMLRSQPIFIFLHVNTGISQHYLLKRLSIPY